MTFSDLQPGIYFNLPAKRYHSDKALSRTNVLALNDTPFTYWEQSWMNPTPLPAREASKEMAFGEAFHTLLFEPERFKRDYAIIPDEGWEKPGIRILHKDYYAIVDAIKVLRAGRDSGLFLSGGKPEVTIVFDDYGLRFRTRHDYLTPVVTPDFKTTFSLDDWHLKKAFGKYGYDVQMALYKRSRTRFKEQFIAGEAHVYGQVDDKFFNLFMGSTLDDFIFIFQRETPPYPYEVLLPEDDTESSGMGKIERAVDVYKKNMEKHGVKPWEVSNGHLKRFSMMYGKVEEN